MRSKPCVQTAKWKIKKVLIPNDNLVLLFHTQSEYLQPHKSESNKVTYWFKTIFSIHSQANAVLSDRTRPHNNNNNSKN